LLFLRFKGFWVFFVRRPNTKARNEPKGKLSIKTPYLSKDKSPVSEGEHHVKNNDEIGESRKSQLKFEYEVYLLNCAMNFFKNLNWAFEVFRVFFKKKPSKT